MPNYQKHLAAGSIIYGLITYASIKLDVMPINLLLQTKTLAACLIGSLFPDIDTKSKIQKYIYFIILIASIYLVSVGLEYQACVLTCLSMLPLIVSHRGLFHRLWFIMMCLAIANFLCYLHQNNLFESCIWMSIFFLIGVISHIWLDMGYKKLFKK
jgi:hypothetical protein